MSITSIKVLIFVFGVNNDSLVIELNPASKFLSDVWVQVVKELVMFPPGIHFDIVDQTVHS